MRQDVHRGTILGDILPAGRDDAFEDYKQFIRDGHPIEDIESYLNTSMRFGD